jgi:hypothetical protein
MIVSEASRGGLWNERQSNLYRLINDQFYGIDSDGVFTNLTNSVTITGSEPCAMPYSFNTQGLVAGGDFFLYDTVNNFRQVTDPDLGSPIDCVWVDGYYFFTDGEYLYHTDLNDESAINPLKFATSEFSPDPTVGVGLTPDDKVIAFNRYTTEFFLNQASANFAFTRIPSRNVMAGIVAPHAKVCIEGVWFCLGSSKGSSNTFFQLGAGTFQNIGTRQTTKILSQYSDDDLQNVVLESRQIDNYQYLIAHLPNETLMFNFTVAGQSGPEIAWTLLASDTNQLDTIPYRAMHGVKDPRRQQWVYGDRYSASYLTYLDSTVATHAGNIAQCAIYTPFIYLETMSADQIEIDTIPGFTSVDDASAFLSLSYDGVTYGTESPIEYGAPSAYTQRFIARRLGYITKRFAMKFRWASQSRMAFGALNLNYS